MRSAGKYLFILSVSIFLVHCETPEFLLEKVSKPIFSPGPGVFYSLDENIAMACETPGAKIYYTTDWSPPTTGSMVYAGPIAISRQMTFKAFAVKEGMRDSDVAYGTYILYIIIEDFTPPISMTTGCSTDYMGGDNNGVSLLYMSETDNYALGLLFDTLGPPESYGVNNQGFAYAQKIFTIDRAGTLYFNFIHNGWDLSGNASSPRGTYEFWVDLDLSEIANPGAPPSWSSTEEEDYLIQESIPIPGPGTYRLTWRAMKDYIGFDEDAAILDHVIFEPQ